MENKTEREELPTGNTLQPRENMVETAVKFLQNAKVRSSPFEQKKSFLKRKGLTDEEIALAIEKSGTVVEDNVKYQPSVNDNTQVATSTYPHNAAVPVVSTWQRARDFTSMVIVIGGISYAVYIIYKKYIAPYFFGPSEEERQLEQLNQSINALKESLADVIRTLEENSRIMTKQQENIQQLLNNPVNHKSTTDLVNMKNTQSTNEIKDEIRSLKGLLLSRRQFPPTPVSSPVLPSWQLTSNSATAGATPSSDENDQMASGDNGDNQLNSEEDNHLQPDIHTRQNDSEDIKDDQEQSQNESKEADKAEFKEESRIAVASDKDITENESQISDQT